MNLDDLKRQIRGQMPDVIASLRAKTAEHAPDAPRREAGYTIQNAAGQEAVVRIYDEIWDFGVNALELTADLDTITAPTIRVEINSPGGSVFDGITIYNALRLHPSRVVTRVDGLAASIASVIAQAGDHRVMVDSSQMMIHNAWGMTMGSATDHEDMAALLAQQDKVIAGIYAANSDQDVDHFLSLMNAETWMTAQDAVDLGLADEVLVPSAQPKDKGPTLVEKITSAAAAVHAALDGAEGLVAAHTDADSPLTGAKREGLVALRDAVGRIDGLLNGPEPEQDEVAAKRAELAKRANSFRAEVPAQFLA